MYYINIYLSLFQVLSDIEQLYIDMNTCQPVSVNPTNAHYYKFHYPNSFTIHKISLKYLEE